MIENNITYNKIKAGKFKDSKTRLDGREEDRRAALSQPHPGKCCNRSELLRHRTLKLIKDNQDTFANFALGVHGVELPAFAADTKTDKYWKFTNRYCDKPKNVSRRTMVQDSKFWAKNDEMYIGDV